MTSEELVRKMYTAIHNAVAPSDPCADSPPTSIFTMMPQGRTIIPEDYAPEKSPANRNRLADVIPHVKKDYEPGMNVSDVYAQILTSQFPPDSELTDQEKQALKEAETYLNDTNTDAYIDKMITFNSARNAYWSAVNNGSKNIEALKAKMEATLLKWQTIGHKEKYETYLSIQRQYYSRTPNKLFREADSVFQQSKRASGYEASYLPVNWQNPGCPLAWADLSINESSTEVRIHKDIQNVSDNFSRHFSTGLWSAAENSKYKDMVSRLNNQTTSCTTTLKLKIARVQIYRDWLNLALLGYKTSWIPGMSQGQISTGSLSGTDKLSMPILPVELVLAQNIEILCNFSEDERRFLEEIKDSTTDTGVNFLWFTVGKNHSEYHGKLTDEEQRKYNANAKITLGKSPVILGFVNSVVPYYAYLDGTKKTPVLREPILGASVQPHPDWRVNQLMLSSPIPESR
ncbi:hypothetical protein V6615_11995 [Oscillospiraceae bacterium PP1C4]